jgi:hypothetical protein
MGRVVVIRLSSFCLTTMFRPVWPASSSATGCNPAPISGVRIASIVAVGRAGNVAAKNLGDAKETFVRSVASVIVCSAGLS